jgi:CheY-like chemotaxis protein
LLVDDNYIQAATRRAILQRTGKEICLARQGQEALEILTTRQPTLASSSPTI